ncbi:MAG: hypothetical protein Q4F50_06885 [Bacteroides sp.]|nr:hypothetical protein [Bacteroides sp.]MDO5419769.1 hypothetical protein [Bacteroides sp.]
MTRSYKKDFQHWRAERETEGMVFYNRLSEVMDTDNDLSVGDMVMFTNDFGVTFGPHEVLAFERPENRDRCIYFDHDAYWFPARPGQLKCVREESAE